MEFVEIAYNNKCSNCMKYTNFAEAINKISFHYISMQISFK